MGKLAVITDLHADINHFGVKELEKLFNLLKEQDVTRLHFAGDTANKIAQTLTINDFFGNVDSRRRLTWAITRWEISKESR